MKDLIAKLTARQVSLAGALDKCRTLELVRERELLDAREARAACEGAKRELDTTLNDLLALEASAPPSKPL